MGCGGSKDTSSLGEQLEKIIPYQKAQEPTNRRIAAWKAFDRRKVEHLNEDDCYMGCKDHLKLGSICKPAEVLNMANKQAFEASHLLRTVDPCTDDVDFPEFRIYLLLLRRYIEMAHLFCDLSKNKKVDPEMKEYVINKEDFLKAIPKLSESCNIKVANGEQVFDELDAEKKGHIPFSKFCSWTRKEHVEEEKQFTDEAQQTVTEVQTKLMDPAERAKIWSQIRPRFPLSDAHSEMLKRDQLFDQFDRFKHGYLTSEDCMQGCIDYLDLLQLLDETQLADLNARAFALAKTLREDGGTPGQLDRAEFKAYLNMIRSYMDMFTHFKIGADEKTREVDEKQFMDGAKELEKDGFKVLDKKTFNENCEDGKMPFLIMCKLIQERNMDHYRETLKQQAEGQRKVHEAAAKRSPEEIEEERIAAKGRKQLWDEQLKERLPRDKTREQNKERTRMFRKFDVNKNRAITYDEFEKGCRSILHLDQFYEPLAPILMRAYDHAAHARPAEQKKGGLVRIERIEFRIALVFIYDYMELFVRFEELGLSTKGQVTNGTFKQVSPILQSWGIKIPDEAAAFKDIDEAAAGSVSFDAMADWAIFKHMQAQRVDVFQRRRSSVSEIDEED